MVRPADGSADGSVDGSAVGSSSMVVKNRHQWTSKGRSIQILGFVTFASNVSMN